eukprot:8706648-Pyramimonas_sp.AAC.2
METMILLLVSNATIELHHHYINKCNECTTWMFKLTDLSHLPHAQPVLLPPLLLWYRLQVISQGATRGDSASWVAVGQMMRYHSCDTQKRTHLQALRVERVASIFSIGGICPHSSTCQRTNTCVNKRCLTI